MKNSLLVLAVLSVLSIQANATGNENNSGCIGNCTTNPSKPSSVTSTSSSSGVNNSRANSNANSKAYSNSDSHATGGNVRDSGNSNSTSTGGSIHDSGNSNSTANGGSVYDSGNSKNTNKNIQDQNQSQKTENANNSNQSVNVQGDSTVYKAPDIPVSSAYAPPAFPTSPCRIALSAGLSLMNIGISGGGSTLDTQCDLRASAQAFAANNDADSAQYLLCSLDSAKKLPKCQAKIKEMASLVPETVTKDSLSSASSIMSGNK